MDPSDSAVFALFPFCFPFPQLDFGTLSSSLMLLEDVLISDEETSQKSELSQSSSLEESSDLPAITVTFRQDHFMGGKHAALF